MVHVWRRHYDGQNSLCSLPSLPPSLHRPRPTSKLMKCSSLHPLYQTKRDSVPSGYLCPLIPPSSGAGRETLGPPQPYPSTLKGGLGHTLYFLGISCRLIAVNVGRPTNATKAARKCTGHSHCAGATVVSLVRPTPSHELRYPDRREPPPLSGRRTEVHSHSVVSRPGAIALRAKGPAASSPPCREGQAHQRQSKRGSCSDILRGPATRS